MDTHLMLGNEAVDHFKLKRFLACTAHDQTEVDRSFEVIAWATKIAKDRLSTVPADV